ncbi:KTSC domain-containing protein [Catenovulum maritimum]|uniref:KTSC domain-containing protein n=1 Tax=Catenovulum maritimum TaxID=1513271 RepID=UPI00066098DF|nr:KTSC domain-containing protein [Catenovulum maritimum]
MKYIFLVLNLLFSSFVYPFCESNVDKIKLHYINGMFTDASGFIANKISIKSFIQNHMDKQFFISEVSGTHNVSEFFTSQIFEVGRHKWEDDEASDAIIEFLNGEYNSSSKVTVKEKEKIQEFLMDINNEYHLTLSEPESIFGLHSVKLLLDTYTRVILITHSQGNFYGNAILSQAYESYSYPDGYKLIDYPMLGIMQLASPVDIPGGTLSFVHPKIIGHLTNTEDTVMALVRATFDSVQANHTSQVNSLDRSGHSLIESYLQGLDGQPIKIAKQLTQIANNLIPYPMHKQNQASSSAIYQFGYSQLNELLDIQFHSKAIYRYEGVTKSKFNQLLTAKSQGGYFNNGIKSHHNYIKLE